MSAMLFKVGFGCVVWECVIGVCSGDTWWGVLDGTVYREREDRQRLFFETLALIPVDQVEHRG